MIYINNKSTLRTIACVVVIDTSGEGVLSFQNLCLILLQNDHAIKYVQINSNQIDTYEFSFNHSNHCQKIHLKQSSKFFL